MIKKVMLCLILFATLISCQSSFRNKTQANQNYVNYYLKVYEADSLYIVKDYAKSYAILDSLFNVYKPLNLEQYKEYETYIACAFALEKPMDFHTTILNSIEFYGTNIRYIKYDSLLNSAYRSSKISNSEALESSQKYLTRLNLNLRDSIIKICEDDQLARKDETMNKIESIDSLNDIKLKLIFDKYGYPHEKLIGEFYIDSTNVNLAAVLLHTRPDFRLNFLLPKILEAVKSGKAYPQRYAEPYDRYLSLTDDGKQLYGSYGSNYKLKNPEKIDSLRRSLGLPNVKYAKWRTKAKYGFELSK